MAAVSLTKGTVNIARKGVAMSKMTEEQKIAQYLQREDLHVEDGEYTDQTLVEAIYFGYSLACERIEKLERALRELIEKCKRLNQHGDRSMLDLIKSINVSLYIKDVESLLNETEKPRRDE